jgi:hypothetical protein
VNESESTSVCRLPDSESVAPSEPILDDDFLWSSGGAGTADGLDTERRDAAEMGSVYTVGNKPFFPSSCPIIQPSMTSPMTTISSPVRNESSSELPR